MARRRMLSTDYLCDEGLNKSPVDVREFFVRLLIVTDDYGIVKYEPYELSVKLNMSRRVVIKLVEELYARKLISMFDWYKNTFIRFKPDRFDKDNSYLLGKRMTSDAMNIRKVIFESEQFQKSLSKAIADYDLKHRNNGSLTQAEELKPVTQEVEEKLIEPKETKKRFIKPTVDEVREFMKSVDLANADVEAQKFVNYYESVGWVVGKSRKPMQKWKSAVRNWITHIEESRATQKNLRAKPSDFRDVKESKLT